MYLLTCTNYFVEPFPHHQFSASFFLATNLMVLGKSLPTCTCHWKTKKGCYEQSTAVQGRPVAYRGWRGCKGVTMTYSGHRRCVQGLTRDRRMYRGCEQGLTGVHMRWQGNTGGNILFLHNLKLLFIFETQIFEYLGAIAVL